VTQIWLASALSDFGSRHWVTGGVAASLAWFLGGRQSIANNHPQGGLLWQCIAVIIILSLCGWTVVKGEWLGFVCGLAVLCFEIWSIRQTLAVQNERK
jgi:hypothetical protein